MQRKADYWPTRAKSLEVKDQGSYEAAADALRGIKLLRDEIEATFGPIVKKAHEAHQEALAQRRKVEAPLAEAERLFKASIAAFEKAAAEARAAEERRRKEDLERAAAEAREAEIEEAERAGATVTEVRAIAERPMYVPPVISAPTYSRPAGISPRENWKAQVEDLGKLVKHVAANPQLVNLLAPNGPALNALARSLKTAANIPGVKVWNDSVVNVRR